MPPSLNPLAICGGPPTIANGPPEWPIADPEIEAALMEAYSSGNWGRYHGPYCATLEQRLRGLHDVPHARLCSSGTVAVELALRGLGLEPGNEVILGAYDFPGNFRCIEDVGARPVLADIAAGHGCLDRPQLEKAYQTTVRAAIVSHLHSGLAPMQAIMEWASEHDTLIIEDACQAPGATVDGRPAGSWGHIGVLSFGGSKLLTAGRGGALLIHDPMHAQRIRVFVERGNDAFPLSELQAAALLPQLEKLDVRNAVRQNSVARLTEATRPISPLRFVGSLDQSPSFYKVAWRYDAQLGKWSREEFIAALRAEGVAVDSGFRGFFRRTGKRCRHSGPLTEAKTAASSTVVLHHPVLLEPEPTIDAIQTAIIKVLDGYANST